MKNLRVCCFLLGSFINAFGIACITKAALGTSPISSVAYVLSMRFPWSLGAFTFLVNMLFIVLQWALLRKQFPLVQLLQIPVNILFSLSIDLSMQLLGWLAPQSLLPQLLTLLVGCVIMAFGICVEVAPNVLTVPGEGAVKAIAHVTGVRFGTVKICFDISLISIALVFSVFAQVRGGVGIGTIICAVLVGKIVNFFHTHLYFLQKISALAQQHS